MGNACGRCHSPLHLESETLRTRTSSPPPLPPPLSQPHPHIEGGDVITSSTTAMGVTETTMDIVVDVDTTATTTGRSPVQEQPSLVMLHATFSQHDAASSSPAGLLQRHLSTTQSSLASSSNTKVGSRAVRFSPNPLSFRSVVMDNFRPMPPSVCPPTPPEAPLNLMGWQPSSLHDANNIIHHCDNIRGQEGGEYAMIKKEHQELLLLRISNPTWSSSCDQQVTDMMTTAADAPPPPAVLPPAIVACDNGGGCYPTTEPGDIPLVISVRGSVSSSSSSSVSAASRSPSMKQQQQQPQLLPPPHAVRRSSLTNSKNPVSPSSCQHLSPTNRSPSKPHHSPTRLDIRSPAKPRIPSLCVGGGGGSGEGGDESPVDINNCNNKSKGCSPLESHHHHHHNHLQHVSVDGVAPLQLDLLHNQDSPNFSCGGGFIAFSEVGGGGNGSQRESFLLVPSDDPAYAPSSLTSETMLQQPDPPLVQQDSMKSTVSWVTSTTFHSTASGSPLLPPGRRPSGFDAFGSNAVSRRTSRNSSIQSIGGGGGGTVSPSHPSSVRRIQVPSLVLTTTSTTATTATSPNAQIA